MLFKDPAQKLSPGEDEVSYLRAMVKKLQTKCNQTASELQDLTRETNNQKQELLDLIREQETEMKFSSAIVSMMLKDSDLFKIRQKSVFDEGKKEWTVPNFILTDKKTDITLPTINAKQRVEQTKEDRNVQLEDHDSETFSQGRVRGNFNATKPRLDSNPPSSNKYQTAREDADRHHQQSKHEFAIGDRNRVSAHKENHLN